MNQQYAGLELPDVERDLQSGRITERAVRCMVWGILLDDPDFETELENAVQTMPEGSTTKRIYAHLLAAYHYRDNWETEPSYKGEGHVVLPDGTQKWTRLEHPTDVAYGVTITPDGESHCERAELASGEIQFNSIDDTNGSLRYAERTEQGNGEIHYGVVVGPDGTKRINRVELPDGKVLANVCISPCGEITFN